jgi:glycogen(starch) synthase
MKLLMTTDTVGGVWTYAVELARALAPHGVQVVLATMGAPPSDAQRKQAAALPNVVLAESQYKLEWMDDPATDVRWAGDWLLGLEARHEPDVVHLNGYTHGSLPFDAPVVIVGHSCVLSWWRRVGGRDAPAEFAWYRRAVPAGLHAADLVVAPTRAMLDELHLHYGRLPRTRVIPNARDPRLYRRGTKEPLVLTAGRVWDEAKNIPALRRAAPRLAWPVYVAGETRSANAAGGTADTSDVIPLGRLTENELAGWYARATIYCLPARYEPFGLSALEAALSACALVLGDIASLREVWGDAAVYIHPDDHDGLAGALIANPDATAELARRAQSRASDYTPQRMAEGYLKAYRDLTSVAWASRPNISAERLAPPRSGETPRPREENATPPELVVPELFDAPPAAHARG